MPLRKTAHYCKTPHLLRVVGCVFWMVIELSFLTGYPRGHCEQWHTQHDTHLVRALRTAHALSVCMSLSSVCQSLSHRFCSCFSLSLPLSALVSVCVCELSRSRNIMWTNRGNTASRSFKSEEWSAGGVRNDNHKGTTGSRRARVHSDVAS